jgi:hypothetical protein
MMVTALASGNFAGRLAKLLRLIVKPDSTEVELRPRRQSESLT